MIGKILGASAAVVALYGLGRAMAQKQKHWVLSHSKDGYALVLTERPTWATVAEGALAAFPCTCNAPEWAYRVGPRRLGVYDDGSNDPVHSLGSLGYQLCVLRNSIAWKSEKDFDRLPLSREQAMALQPGFVLDMDEIFSPEPESA